MSNMDTPEGTIDPQNEVKKLQELVKKLEKQNEVLRGKHGSVLDKQKQIQNSVDDVDSIIQKTSELGSDVFSNNKRNSCGLEDLDDVDHSVLSVEEDSWWVC